MKQLSASYFLLFGAFLIAGCDQSLSSDTVALVNGEPITSEELNEETLRLYGARVKTNDDKRAALQRIIDRRLLADQARKDGLDRTQDYLLADRRLQEILLVQTLAENLGAKVGVEQLVAANPNLFADRMLYEIDLLEFRSAGATDALRHLSSVHKMDDVALKLGELGIQYKRRSAILDSASLPPEILQRATSLPAGEPFLLPGGDTIRVAVLMGRKKAPVVGKSAEAIATRFSASERAASATRKRLDQSIATADIQYQPGFGPTPRKGS